MRINKTKNDYRIHRDDELFNIIKTWRYPKRLNAFREEIGNSSLLQELVDRNIQMVVPLQNTDEFLGFIALSNKMNDEDYTAEEQNILLVLANQFVTALTTARFYVEAVEKRRMEDELEMARQIQANLLPKELPDEDHFALAAFSSPSHTVGGDFYDYIPIDENRCGLVIADACGKGLPAAMLISQIQAMLKSEINNGNNIQNILYNINEQVVRFTPKDKVVTLFFGIYNKKSNEFEYTNAGHNFPILVRENGKSEYLQVGGPVLGMVKNVAYQTGTIRLNLKDILFFYTDGVTETMNDNKQEYGEERLLDTLIQCREQNVQKIIEAVLDDLLNYTHIDSAQDDRTMLVLKV